MVDRPAHGEACANPLVGIADEPWGNEDVEQIGRPDWLGRAEYAGRSFNLMAPPSRALLDEHQ
jgi:hypothetical protein